MSKKETFGGVWTIEKLDILSKYLDFYEYIGLISQAYQLN